MNVYTHFQTIEEYGVGYRWRTLLQFGSSWDIIGSVVMKNPGSARYEYGKDVWIKDASTLAHLSSFEYPGDEGKRWYEFKSDQTMNCVAELFAEYYKQQGLTELNGIIQIFNLFYLKDPDLSKALKANKELFIFREINDNIFEQDIKNIKKPVYLGFSKLAKSSDFRKKAELFFNEAIEKHNASYLNSEFDTNSFTHPLALMRYYKNEPSNILLRERFCSDNL